MRRNIFLVISALGFALSAHAQIDPSSALLLNGDAPQTALDSGRYTIRPKTEPTPKPARKQIKTYDDVNPPAPVTVNVPAQPTPIPTPVSVTPAKPAPYEPPPQPAFVYVPAAGPSPQPKLEVTPKDLRRYNILEINVAPGYVYNNSDSIYTYRNYTTASPTASVEASVWFSPNIGLHGSYLTTVNDSVSDSLNNSRNEPVTQDWFTAGFRGRKFFGTDALAPSLSFGIDYTDYNFRVASNATMREKLESEGVQITLDAEIPASSTRTWNLGVSFAPILAHSESSTNIGFQSGTSVNAISVGVNFGGRFQLSRFDGIFWRLSYTIEKDLFGGTATLADPQTGIAPTGVSVTNSFGLIQIGYAWGD